MPIHAEPVPLRVSPDGLMIYVGNSRVPLETVIYAFDAGDTPEEIVMQYPALTLASVYQVIGYYLEHQEEVETYIQGARAHSERVRRENEVRFDVAVLRERLLGRKKRRS